MPFGTTLQLRLTLCGAACLLLVGACEASDFAGSGAKKGTTSESPDDTPERDAQGNGASDAAGTRTDSDGER